MNTAPKTVMHLDDLVIARIAQCLQEAILTGTDISDILRSMQLEVKDDKVVLASGYVELIKAHHDKLLNDIASMENKNA